MSNRLYSNKNMNKPFWYKPPSSLSWDDWESWRVNTRQQYPIQYFFREDVSLYFSIRWSRIKDLKYKIKCFFFPKHQEIRKAIPRTWTDISNLVVDLNFAMILSFKKEADESWVDWGGTEGHRKFKNWLDAAAGWIQKSRPELEKQRDNSYPPHPLPAELKGKTYDELYGEVNRIEKLINETDTNILKQMIEYRDYLWT
jgi:hypothetical protein